MKNGRLNVKQKPAYLELTYDIFSPSPCHRSFLGLKYLSGQIAYNYSQNFLIFS